MKSLLQMQTTDGNDQCWLERYDEHPKKENNEFHRCYGPKLTIYPTELRGGDDGQDDPAEGSGVKTAVPPAQGFEWIAHGDASARRRARAHVTRGFRRAKAAQAQLEKGEDVVPKKGKKTKGGSPPESESGSSGSPGSSTTSPAATTPLYMEEVGGTTSALTVQSLGSGRKDPFSSLPVNMGPDTHALLDHCESTRMQAPYSMAERAWKISLGWHR